MYLSFSTPLPTPSRLTNNVHNFPFPSIKKTSTLPAKPSSKIAFVPCFWILRTDTSPKYTHKRSFHSGNIVSPVDFYKYYLKFSPISISTGNVLKRRQHSAEKVTSFHTISNSIPPNFLLFLTPFWRGIVAKTNPDGSSLSLIYGPTKGDENNLRIVSRKVLKRCQYLLEFRLRTAATKRKVRKYSSYLHYEA